MRNGKVILLGILCSLFVVSAVFGQTDPSELQIMTRLSESVGRMDANVESLTQTVGDLKTTVDDLKTLKTTVGDLKTSVDDLKTSVNNLNGKAQILDRVETLQYVILAALLAIATGVVVSFLTMQRSSSNGKKKDNDETRTEVSFEAIHQAAAYNSQGYTKNEQERYLEAISDYDKAIELKPDFAQAYYNRGVAKRRLNSVDAVEAAIKDFNRVISLKGDSSEVYYNRGRSKSSLGDVKGAEQDFKKALTFAQARHESLKEKIEWRLQELK